MVDAGKMVMDLVRDEGLRLKPYRDTVGKLTIGVGRNLDDVGINEIEAKFLLGSDVQRAQEQLIKILPYFEDLCEVRQRVLVNMCFNIGIMTLLTFHHFLGYVEGKAFVLAAQEMMHSKWASQVGERAVRLSKMMETGLDVT